jgi:prophage regulatory protein
MRFEEDSKIDLAPKATATTANEGANNALPRTGLVRLKSILAPNGPIPCSRSTWFEGVKSGRFPKPLSLGGRITAWRAEDIHALIEHGVTPPKKARP